MTNSMLALAGVDLPDLLAAFVSAASRALTAMDKSTGWSATSNLELFGARHHATSAQTIELKVTEAVSENGAHASFGGLA
jgi:hypothetical protein